MKILKFGGTSVANANNIKLVLSIVENTAATSTKLVIVVSAFSGITDLLILAASKAASKDITFKDVVSQIEEKHKEVIEELIISSKQKILEKVINSDINHLKTLLDGCFLLGELSNRTSDTIMGFACFTIFGFAVNIPLTSVQISSISAFNAPAIMAAV